MLGGCFAVNACYDCNPFVWICGSVHGYSCCLPAVCPACRVYSSVSISARCYKLTINAKARRCTRCTVVIDSTGLYLTGQIVQLLSSGSHQHQAQFSTARRNQLNINKMYRHLEELASDLPVHAHPMLAANSSCIMVKYLHCRWQVQQCSCCNHSRSSTSSYQDAPYLNMFETC